MHVSTIGQLGRMWTYLAAKSNELDHDLGLTPMLVLLYIAENEKHGIISKKVIEFCVKKNLAKKSPVDRAINALKAGTKGRPGLGFITEDGDPMDRRAKPLKLTPAGRKFLEELQNA